MLVNNAVKVSPKKREHQTRRNFSLNFLFASGTVRYTALWYLASLSLYAWCVYWISRDIFVWHKPLAEVSMLCYAGSIASVALIWLGSRVWRSRQVEARKPAPLKKTMQPPQAVSVSAGPTCSHYLGYLRQLKKSAEIPAECLTCKQVIQCFSTERGKLASS
jgi:hypothetical protein